MDFNLLLQKNNNYLKKLDIKQLEFEKITYYTLLSTNSFDNDFIMHKINFINYLIYQKKNN